MPQHNESGRDCPGGNELPLEKDTVVAKSHINMDTNKELTVVESDGELVGMLQLTFIPYLTHMGSRQCLIFLTYSWS